VHERLSRFPPVLRIWSSRPLAPFRRARRRPAERREEASLNSPEMVPAELSGTIPARKLWIGPDDPFSHLLGWPFEYRVYLALLCNLRPSGTRSPMARANSTRSSRPRSSLTSSPRGRPTTCVRWRGSCGLEAQPCSASLCSTSTAGRERPSRRPTCSSTRSARGRRPPIREAIQRLAAGAGLRVVRLIPGYWSLPDAPSVNEQDPGAVSAGLSPGTPPRREAQSCSDPLSPVITTCCVGDQTWPGSGLSRK
jgi:hypothetical protein